MHAPPPPSAPTMCRTCMAQQRMQCTIGCIGCMDQSQRATHNLPPPPALPCSVRAIMPGVPPLGIGIDYFGE